MANPRTIVLTILDGFGMSSQTDGNAIRSANTPTINRLWSEFPVGPLEASGIAVGVMWGEPGNSEVGHLGIGAGMVVYQNLPRIQLAIEDKSFFNNLEFIKACKRVQANGGTLHLLGLCSSGGVHAHIEHLEHLLALCQQQGVDRVAIHMITDGRDTAPQKALEFVAQIRAAIKQYGRGKIATVAGRYYSMDRNTNWDRVQKAYEAMTEAKGSTATTAEDAVQQSYTKQIFDEEIVPTVIVDGRTPVATINDGDALIFFNYREDRARQLTQAFVVKGFSGFTRAKIYTDLLMVTMIEYEKDLPVCVAFPPQPVTEPLGKVIADQGLAQLRIAETEKYAHVTYFFNGGGEKEYANETRVLVPSKKVESYATVPEMSAREITERLVAEIVSRKYALIVTNFANADMVGHTGDFNATVKGVEVVDQCLAKIVSAVEQIDGVLVITADHGNAEQKKDPSSGQPSKEHTANPVPLCIVDQQRRRQKSSEEITMLLDNPTPIGILADVAPTILELMGLPKPPEMTGKSLLSYMV
ncbi:2,3-bisphosphoglycerate-independent phosphoglycerate mutase [Candidatus Uhrbacteria bacterium]|nr:2,3-bisphosphoglycerate-independent phosphoglycerate mutase [Candidatus Uhrbacteria bacterium]